MKNISEYLNDSINEGLIGDIIMELLRRGLNWVDKGIDLVSDSIKTSLSSTWDIIKDNARKSESAQEIVSRGEKDFYKELNNKVFNDDSFDSRQQSIEDYVNNMFGVENFDAGMSIDGYKNIYVELTYQNYLMTVNSTKVNQTEKKKATKLIQTLQKNSKLSPYIKEIENRNKK